MSVEFHHNNRLFHAFATPGKGVRVEFGCITLTSDASPNIFRKARAALGLPECQVVSLH
jgi:hypothetical protein